MAIVKIQHRRGNYADYDPSKVLPGELVVTQADDPNSTDGEAVYIATTAGNVKQLATMQDMQSVVDTAIEGAISGVTERVEEYIEEIETTGAEVLDSIPADYTQLSEDVDTLKDDLSDVNDRLLLLDDNVPNTVQTYTFTNGSVSKVEHKNGNTLIRSDIFTYGETTITETRTLNTGSVLTIVTNLTTLETTVTYTAA